MHSQSKLQTNTRGKGEEHISRGQYVPINVCHALASSSTVAVSDVAFCMMAAASSSCASAGPSEPTAPTQAQHVTRWIDVAEIPTPLCGKRKERRRIWLRFPSP